MARQVWIFLFAFVLALVASNAVAGSAVEDFEDLDSDVDTDADELQPELDTEDEDIDIDDVDGDVDEDEDGEDSEDEDDDEDDDMDEEDEASPDAAAARRFQRIAAKKAHVRHMYNALLHKYHKLRNEIANKVELVVAKKYAWLKLLYSRRRWYILNRRYRSLVHKFKALPKKQFLVNAYKKYTQSEEYKLKESRKQYQLTCERAHRYMHNLHKWIRMQKYKIRQLRLSLRHFLHTYGHNLTPEEREKLRISLRKKAREEREKLNFIDQYWKERIFTGDLPFPEKNPVKEAKPVKIPTPHPMVAPLSNVPRARAPKLPSSFNLLKEKRNWDAILDQPETEGAPLDKIIGKALLPSVPKASGSYNPGGWFSPVYDQVKRRRAHSQSRRLRHERERIRILEQGKKGIRRSRKGAVFRKWKRAIRGSFRKAWNQK